MSWTNVEHNCKILYYSQYINGSNPMERKVLIRLIADEFPEFSRMKIAFAVDRCINDINAPMSPNTFLTFVQGYLK